MRRSSSWCAGLPALFIVPCAAIAALVLMSACSGPGASSSSIAHPSLRSAVASSAVQREEARLLVKYGLCTQGAPASVETTLQRDCEFTEVQFTASKRMGFDLGAYVGKRVRETRYTLVDRSTAETTITAVFFSARDKVIGAVLETSGYNGGFQWPLDQHDQFAPPGGVLTADHLVFSGVQSIEMRGPRPKSHCTVRDAAQISRVLSLITKSKRCKDLDIAYAESEYWLHMKYTNGAVTDIDLNRSKADKSLYVCFSGDGPADLYLRPAPGLTAYLDQLLRSGR